LLCFSVSVDVCPCISDSLCSLFLFLLLISFHAGIMFPILVPYCFAFLFFLLRTYILYFAAYSCREGGPSCSVFLLLHMLLPVPAGVGSLLFRIPVPVATYVAVYSSRGRAPSVTSAELRHQVLRNQAEEVCRAC
jgi:hypothetical protein